MGSSPQAPAAPDPTATAAAQTTSNQATANYNYGLNATNQVTPYGNLTYTQSGTPGTPGGYTATQTLSPEQQNLYNLGTQTQSNLGNIGVEQSDKVRNLLNTPFDLNSAISTQQSDMATKLLDPVWQQRQSAFDAQMANQGVQPGTEAYDNAARDFGAQRDADYNSAALAGRAQASTEALAQRNQPLNEITALLNNSQVQQPGFTATPQSNVANTDVAGITNSAFQNQFANYNAQMTQQNAIYGALGGAAGTALGGWGMGGFKMPKAA